MSMCSFSLSATGRTELSIVHNMACGSAHDRAHGDRNERCIGLRSSWFVWCSAHWLLWLPFFQAVRVGRGSRSMTRAGLHTLKRFLGAARRYNRDTYDIYLVWAFLFVAFAACQPRVHVEKCEEIATGVQRTAPCGAVQVECRVCIRKESSSREGLPWCGHTLHRQRHQRLVSQRKRQVCHCERGESTEGGTGW